MSEFVVHTIPGSPFGRAVIMLLEEKGAPWRLAPVSPQTLKVAPHLERHPFGRVPALEHGDFTLYETQAILRYVDRVAPEPRFTPADARAAGRMDQVMNVNDWYLFQGVGAVIGFQRFVKPLVLGEDADEAAIAAAMPNAHVVFAELSRLLGDAPFFAGGEVSLADVAVAGHLDIMSTTPEWAPLTDGRPNIAAWLERMRGRASMAASTMERLNALAGRP